MQLNPQKTAFLTLDFINGIVKRVIGSESIIENAAEALKVARQKDFLIIHVGLNFLPGHPEIPNEQKVFTQFKQNNLFMSNTESSAFHPKLGVLPKDIIIGKKRFSAFSGNELDMILRANGIEHLILLGISTSGIVLSTLRQAFDLDYKCTVLKDACFDKDTEVHNVLVNKIFTVQADVISVKQFSEL